MIFKADLQHLSDVTLIVNDSFKLVFCFYHWQRRLSGTRQQDGFPQDAHGDMQLQLLRRAGSLISSIARRPEESSSVRAQPFQSSQAGWCKGLPASPGKLQWKQEPQFVRRQIGSEAEKVSVKDSRKPLKAWLVPLLIHVLGPVAFIHQQDVKFYLWTYISASIF